MSKGTPWGWVYLISAADDGLVKIGYEQRRGSRLASLQTGSPSKLYRMHDFPAYRDAERALHEAFAASRRRGEWFGDRETIELTFLSLWELYEDKAQELAGDDPHWTAYLDQTHITAAEATEEARYTIAHLAANPDYVAP